MRVLIAAALFAATALLYWPATTFDFISLDDPNYVFDNRQVQAGLTREGVRWAFTTVHASHWHPLTWLSLMLDAELWGSGPRGFHTVNVLLHAANTALCFLALRALTGASWASALVAALFAVHPLRVESVAWVTERKDVLSGLMFMLALLAYAGYAMRGGLVRYLFVALAFALGLLAKPMIVTLPALLLLLDLWPLRRWTSTPLSRLVLQKAPLLALSLASVAATLLATRSTGALHDLHAISPSVRVANAAIGYVAYLRTAVWPSGLSAVYPHRAALGPEAATALLWPGLLAGAGLIVLSVLVCAALKRRPYLFVGWFWFVGMLVPVSGLLQAGFQARADRFTYLPMIGLFLAAVWSGADLAARWPRTRPLLAALAAAALVASAAVTRAQLATWRNAETVLVRAVAVTDDNYYAHGNLGTVLSSLGRVAEAEAHYQSALRIKPDYGTALTGLGALYSNQGRLAESAELLQRALEAHPDSPVVLANLGAVRFRQGEFDAAAVLFERAAALAPDYAIAHTNLGAIYFRRGELDRAAEHLARAVVLNPHSVTANTNLGRVRMQQGRWAEAEVALEAALRIRPDNADAQQNLAVVRARLGRP